MSTRAYVSLWPKGVNHARMTGAFALSKILHFLVELAVGNVAFKAHNAKAMSPPS
jgi:hypothetical protein